MRTSVYFILTFLALSSCFGAETKFPSYQAYVKQFGKSYRTKEYTQREFIYNLNLEKIAQHNEKYLTGEVSYTAGINQFTDLSEEEFQSYIQGKLFTLILFIKNLLAPIFYHARLWVWTPNGHSLEHYDLIWFSTYFAHHR